MGRTQKEQLADELFRAQPHVFASFLVQKQLGVSRRRWISWLISCSSASRR